MSIEIFRLILDILSMIAIIFLVINVIRTQRKIFKHIFHLYDLCDCLVSGCNPFVSRIYNKIRTRGPKKISKQEWHNISREFYLSDYAEVQKRLDAARKTASPEEMEYIEKTQKTLDEIVMLMETTGPDTSPEHNQKIINEIIHTLEKVRQGS